MSAEHPGSRVGHRGSFTQARRGKCGGPAEAFRTRRAGGWPGAPASAASDHFAHACRQPGHQFEHPHQIARQRIRSILPPLSSPHILKRCKPRLRARALTHSAVAARSL